MQPLTTDNSFKKPQMLINTITYSTYRPKPIHMETLFTLETQMGKPTSNVAQCFISTISGYNAFMALCPSSSPWPKDPLRMKFMREIGRDGGVREG
jgi:hypothetical protein